MDLKILISFICDEYNGYMKNKFCDKKCKLTEKDYNNSAAAIDYLNNYMYEGKNFINIKLYIKLYIVLHHFINKFKVPIELKKIYELTSHDNINNNNNKLQIHLLLYNINKIILNITLFYNLKDDKIYNNMNDLLLEKIYLLHVMIYNLLYKYLEIENKFNNNHIINSIFSLNNNNTPYANAIHFYNFFNKYINKIEFNYITYNNNNVIMLNPNHNDKEIINIINSLVSQSISTEKKLKENCIYVYKDGSDYKLINEKDKDKISTDGKRADFLKNTKIDKNKLYI